MARPEFSTKALLAAGNLKHIQDTARVLGLKHLPSSELELADIASRGLPSSTLSNLSGSLGWSQAALVQQLGIAPRTAARRLTSRRPLSVSESERILRLARLLARATEIFEDRASAKAWLVEKNAALGGRTPLDLIATEIGAEVVFNELGKIDHGFFA
jgi:putative toxin-antitoxin system antitoxin component (TIGR02293 family)